jgi:hypothetical protein
VADILDISIQRGYELALDGEYPKAWKPKVGELLVGRLICYDSGVTDYGQVPIAIVESDENGEQRAGWMLHHVLRDEFRKKRPHPGERIGIKRLPDAAKGYKRYVLRVDRREAQVPNFDQFAPTGDVAPEDQGKLDQPEHDGDLPF